MKNNELGRYVRKTRKGKQIKLRQLAAACNCSIAYIADFERGIRGHKRTNPDFLIKISSYLNIPMSVLLSKANITLEASEEDQNKFFKILNSKSKAKHFSNSFSTLKELLIELEDSVVGMPPSLRKLSGKLNEVVEEIEGIMAA